jgi:hypothetical protein
VFTKSSQEFVPLTAPSYHPADTFESSFDIAVCEVKNFGKASSAHLAFDQLSVSAALPGDSVSIRGFSVTYLSKRFNPSSSRRLSSERFSAVVEEAPLERLRVHGFSRGLKELQFARTSNGMVIGEDVSGGPVFKESNRSCVGMFIASVDANWTLPSGRIISARGGAFISSLYIREVISSL